MAGSVFLTGASGFLGRRLLERLAGSGHTVVCLGRRKPALESRNVGFIPGDLLDREACRRAIAGCQTVIHLAAATGKHRPADYFRVNRDGTAVVVEEAQRAGVERLLFASTVAVKFTDLRHYWYAQSKQQAEKIVAESGLCWTIVRPTMIFGRGSPVLDGLRRLAALPLVPVFGDGRASVQPVFVEDLACAIAALLEEPAAYRRIVEIGGPQVLSMEELLLRIRAGGTGRQNRATVHLPARPVAMVLGWLEPFLRPLLPVTAGQLASFTNDGTAEPGPWTGAWLAGMRNIDEMLAEKHGSV
jgi:nucleoside-diphosphate-sugar epimerase